MTELVLVVVTIGLTVALGVSQYQNVIHEARQKTAKLNLNFIKIAQDIYLDENGFYYPKDAATNSIAAINSALDLSIIAENLIYSCSAGGGGFTCTASYGATWSCHINQSMSEATCP